MFSSPLMHQDYERIVPDYATYQRERERRLEQFVAEELQESGVCAPE